MFQLHLLPIRPTVSIIANYEIPTNRSEKDLFLIIMGNGKHSSRYKYIIFPLLKPTG